MAILAAISMVKIVNILCVALVLGLVIFIHELGHFAVAKWNDVRVERFSIGFGPVLWKFTRGETEYALSAIPFGGYVKMLGQDDADPSQLTDVRIARDPRSYTSKTVPQRIAIISAGVINNMVSAVLFFILAFMMGVQYQPAIVGYVSPGMPAWVAGLRLGDRLTRVNGREDKLLRFNDVKQAVALSSGNVEIEGIRDGKPFSVTVDPLVKGQLFPTIGIEPELGLTFHTTPDEPEKSPTAPDTPASAATPPFRSGDEIKKIDNIVVDGYAKLIYTLAAKGDQTVAMYVHRKGEPDEALTKIMVGPNMFRTLGLRMDIGKITAIQHGSPADLEGAPTAKLKVGDKITHVIVDGEEKSVGIDLDPLRLPGFFAALHGKQVTLKVKREVPAKDPETVEVTLVPDNRPGWVERPMAEDAPLSVPALGIAYHVLHHVVHVDQGSPADGKIAQNDNIQKLEFIPKGGTPNAKDTAIQFGEDKRNWASAFWMMQQLPEMTVKLTVRSQGHKEDHVVELTPVHDTTWFLPIRGFLLDQLTLTRKAENIGEAVQLGFRNTRDAIVEMWLTIRSLSSGRISMQALGGPIAIAQVAYYFSERGIPDLVLFLGMLSVSLAVLNFLPIPVLDGGHFVFLCWEGIRGKPASERVVIAANYVGLALVLSLMIWVLYMDISKLLT